MDKLLKSKPELLKFLGVRYVITTKSVLDGAKEIIEITQEGDGKLKLFEFEEPNISSVSATRIIVAEDGNAQMQIEP